MHSLSPPMIQIWSDSFKEGEWILQNLASKYYSNRFEVSFRYNFQPIFSFVTEERHRFVAEVYGGYTNWIAIPPSIKKILKYGKPDVIVYDPTNEKIILSIEETAAVPTGNQSLQRLERVWFSAKNRTPFVYLIGEYGLHKDGGVRRSSIWPVYLALKLSSQYRVPSLTLFYGSSTSSEDYSVGTGVSDLTELLHIYIMEWFGHILRENKQKILQSIFSNMCAFIKSQAEEITVLLPGTDVMDESLIDYLVERAME